MNEREKSAIYAALLRASIAAIRVERRRALAASIGWHPDEQAEATDLALLRSYMNHARLELQTAQTRERWQRRQSG
jgi:hypothetical protein